MIKTAAALLLLVAATSAANLGIGYRDIIIKYNHGYLGKRELKLFFF